MRLPRCSLLLLACLWLVPVHGVAAGDEVEGRILPHQLAFIEFLRETMGDVHADILLRRRQSLSSPHSFTHVLVDYTASRPFPVTVSLDAQSPSALDTGWTAGFVLPSTTHAMVLLPVTSVPGWGWTDRSAVVTVVSDPAVSPSIRRMALISRSGGLWGSLAQFATAEPRRLSDVNFLTGYRLFGVSFSLLLGLAMVVAVLFLARRRGVLRAATSASFAVMLLYGARFAIDLVRSPIADLAQWNERGSYGEMGDLYAAAESLAQLAAERGSLRAVACDRAEAPLRYLAPSVEIAGVAEADVAVVLVPWTNADGSFPCADARVRGTSLRTLPGGGQIIELARTPSPAAP